ncbi:uncharacterized protein EI90DRAFT_3216552 [Cantharellus anzutake]|uniref:uncharacterized protein n=1 Tax=Cantharellus anzutake TaxID=1750568 RepID=UPI0019059467|nr:uncharacterized protein EI90DRAFT_3216552 [Cantharellus anzutake]KAF8328343.1 hypothetical protein EI90DRAFT_3216552 [Cantharellus anzutake]
MGSLDRMNLTSPVNYVVNYLFDHLDPSQLLLQQPNELHNEFNHFLTKNLLSFVAMCGKLKVLDELLQHKDHGSLQLLTEAKMALGFLGIHGANMAFSWPPDQSSRPPFFPWHLYRSVLPFSPSSSLLFQWYRHLSDPVKVFSITGEFSGHSIPLSDNALRTWKIMEGKLRKPKEVGFRAEFLPHDVRNGVAVCATLSADGRYIALGFGSSAIEIADIDGQCTIFQQWDMTEPPSWIEFVCGNTQIATEDIRGNIVILGHGPQPVKVGSIPNDNLSVITAVADNGSFIVRVSPKHWHKNIEILHVLEQPSIQYLTFPNISSPPGQPFFTVTRF